MHQNFENDDFLLTDKISYRFGEPKRGDVVIFRAPPSEPCSEEECEYIKRIIALPGEKLEVKDGAYFINDQRLTENYLPKEIITSPGTFMTSGKSIILGEYEYFVSGDNRPYSHDSRSFGTIKKTAIVGKAWLRYWPPSKIGLIPKAGFD